MGTAPALVTLLDCVAKRWKRHARTALIARRLRGPAWHALSRVDVLLLHTHRGRTLRAPRGVSAVRRWRGKGLAVRRWGVLGVRRHGRQAGTAADMRRSSCPRGEALRLGKLSHRSVVRRTLSEMLNPRGISTLTTIVARVARVAHVAHLTRVSVITRVARVAVIARWRNGRRSRVKSRSRTARSRINLPLPLPKLALTLLVIALLLVTIVRNRVSRMRRQRRSINSSGRIVGVRVAVRRRPRRVPIGRVSIVGWVWRPVRVVGMLRLVVVGRIAPIVSLGRRASRHMLRRVWHGRPHFVVR